MDEALERGGRASYDAQVKLYFFIRAMAVDSRQLASRRIDADIHELLFCRAGSGELVGSEGTSRVEPGVLLFDPRGRVQAEGGTVELIQVFFSEQLFSQTVPMEREALYVLGIIKLHARTRNNIVLSPIGTDRITMLLDSMLWEFRERRRGYSWALRLKLIELLITVMRDRDFPIPIPGLKPLPTTRMQDVILYLEREYLNPVSVDDVLEFCPFSRSHFHALFKEETGVTFVEYLTALRCEHAGRLLREGDRPIVEIALESGFNNLSHFYHVFKRHYGLSPRRYRLGEVREG
ncbi:MAG: helix-turn-helix transcriptional regulator [Spirochaetota bacterium]